MEQNTRVLVVDDDPVSSRLLDLVMQRQGYETRVAPSGREALSLFASEGNIGLMILDLSMPAMDGLTLLELLRKRSGGDTLPVLVCTAHADRFAIARAVSLGVTQVLRKPFTLPELISKVERLVSTPPAPPPAESPSDTVV